MKIKSQKFFILSLLMLTLAVLQFYLSNLILESTATRDFNFGPPFAIMLSAIQIVVALLGVGFSLSKK